MKRLHHSSPVSIRRRDGGVGARLQSVCAVPAVMAPQTVRTAKIDPNRVSGGCPGEENP